MVGGRSASISSRLPRRIRQDVVEVVRDAARQRSERIELLGFANALLQPPPLRDVRDDADHARGLAFFDTDSGRDGDPSAPRLVRRAMMRNSS